MQAFCLFPLVRSLIRYFLSYQVSKLLPLSAVREIAEQNSAKNPSLIVNKTRARPLLHKSDPPRRGHHSRRRRHGADEIPTGMECRGRW